MTNSNPATNVTAATRCGCLLGRHLGGHHGAGGDGGERGTRSGRDLTRRPEHGIEQRTRRCRVEPVLDRDQGDARIPERLRNDERRNGDAGDDIEPEVGSAVPGQPLGDRQQAHRSLPGEPFSAVRFDTVGACSCLGGEDVIGGRDGQRADGARIVTTSIAGGVGPIGPGRHDATEGLGETLVIVPVPGQSDTRVGDVAVGEDVTDLVGGGAAGDDPTTIDVDLIREADHLGRTAGVSRRAAEIGQRQHVDPVEHRVHRRWNGLTDEVAGRLADVPR